MFNFPDNNENQEEAEIITEYGISNGKNMNKMEYIKILQIKKVTQNMLQLKIP